MKKFLWLVLGVLLGVMFCRVEFTNVVFEKKPGVIFESPNIKVIRKTE